jgi:ATP-dependent Clp protease ATP-binding subunit ClpC
MFARFTERARQVVVLTQDEARALRHHHIGTEHLVLGLLREEDGLGARVLESLGVTLEQARERVRVVVGEGDPEEPALTGQIPFTPRAKKALELALREALSMNHRYIGTEHVLLGLVRLGEGVGVEILESSGAPPDVVRNEVIRLLSGPR